MRVFDGHNDILTRAHDKGLTTAFLAGGGATHLDVPRMAETGFNGIFAIFTPVQPTDKREYFVPVDHEIASRYTASVLGWTLRLVRRTPALRIITGAPELDGEGVGMVLHIEGAEALDTDLHALEVLYAAGWRSLGLVWSRPNAFAEGVPFKFPESPDTGPGLTDAGRGLVEACNDLGVLIDLSHLNEQGFWDVAKLSNAPLVASHSNAHAICPSTRNLTDQQLDAVAATGGLVGVNFGVGFMTEDGPAATPENTGTAAIVKQVAYLADRMGVDHVGLGSDFDGTRIPAELGSVSGMPALLAELRASFSEDEVEKIAYRNWHRVLTATWS